MYSMPTDIKRTLHTLEALMMTDAPVPPMVTTDERA